ncbi:two-component response regulator-like APRR3 [Argentina anserina]|uniref:two-component response regulator-like APRR3 n=1 Tax=Argentina anserina TaxID=57926 RepID=UPI0021762528|nr:two-component response regulator-like APRR3 [Potentilla anserina]
MCHTKNSPPPPNHDRHVRLHQTRSMSMMKIIKEEEEERETKPAEKAPGKSKRAAARKSRKKKSRRKKPKYLSLRSSRLSAKSGVVVSSARAAAEADEVDTDIKMTEATTTTARRPGQQLNLFPLHPELNAAEADHQSDDNVALLFESHGGATLHGLLTSTDTATATTTSTMSSDHDQDESNYSSYAYRRGGDIVRTAMRGSGGDPSVEKWVCYSELVKEEVELTATTSSASTCCSVGDDRKKSHQNQRLALKLDYTEVLNAWSDKGSLYIKAEDGEPPPQTVPDLLQDQLFEHLHDSSANIEDLWRVPVEGGSGSGSLARKTQRQESLMRYKQKRENRLFSKRIRYEVRKLNAEKRPRIKGRFVRNS